MALRCPSANTSELVRREWSGSESGSLCLVRSLEPTTGLMFRRFLHLGYVASLLRLVCTRDGLEMSLYVLSNGRCIAIPSQTVQMHKGLTDEVRIITEDIGPSEGDPLRATARLMRLYAEKEETLWAEAHRLCNAVEDAGQHSSGAFTLKNDFNNQFALAGTPKTPPPPAMTLTPLLVSGPSENRVDLVFFGDGCRCHV
jgi:hypothetical protein